MPRGRDSGQANAGSRPASERDAVAVAAEFEHGRLQFDLHQRQVRRELVAFVEDLTVDDQHPVRGGLGIHRPADRERRELAADVVRLEALRDNRSCSR